MSLVSHIAAPLAEQEITSMPESGLIVLSIGAMILLGALLIPAYLASRAPRRTEPASMPPWSAPVQGGVHPGDGRSVAPHRDAPVEAFGQEKVVQAQADQDRGADTEEG